MGNRKGGIIELKIDGRIYQAKGDFTYGMGKRMREAVVGVDGVHGFKETIVAPFIEGEITDAEDLSLDDLAAIEDATVTLQLNNGKIIALRNAWNTNKDGLGANTGEGNIGIRFEGMDAEEV